MKVIALIGEGNAGIMKGHMYEVVEEYGDGGVMVLDDDGEHHLLASINHSKVGNTSASRDITKQLADALRAILNDGGPAAMGTGYEALAAYDARTKTIRADQTSQDQTAWAQAVRRGEY